jgi:hypothetical protein
MLNSKTSLVLLLRNRQLLPNLHLVASFEISEWVSQREEYEETPLLIPVTLELVVVHVFYIVVVVCFKGVGLNR